MSDPEGSQVRVGVSDERAGQAHRNDIDFWYHFVYAALMSMRVVIINGGTADEAQLVRIAYESGVSCELVWRSVEALREPGVPAREAPGVASAQALVIDRGTVELPRVVAVFEAVKATRHFEETLILLSLAADRVGELAAYHGLDDFVVEPCPVAELAHRIAAAERRRSSTSAVRLRSCGGMMVDRAAQQVLVDGRLVQLTSKEFALLSCFCEQTGRVLSRKELVEQVWGREYRGGLRTVDVHVRRLRFKLGAALSLETLRSSGYRLRFRAPVARAMAAGQPPSERQSKRAQLSSS